MLKLSSNVVGVSSLVLIGLLALVPNYIQLPPSVNLILNNNLGRLGLLVLALYLGDQDFKLGLLLATFVLKMMMFPVREGFEDFEDGEELEEAFEDHEEEEDDANSEFKSLKKCNKAVKKLKNNKNDKIKQKNETIKRLRNKLDKWKEARETREEEEDDVRSTQEPVDEVEMRRSEEESVELDEGSGEELGEGSGESGEEFRETVEGFSCGCGSKTLREAFKDAKAGERKPVPCNSDCDKAGCRFDYNSETNVNYPHGEPLSSCGTYNAQQANNVGTIFYPIN